MSQPDLKPTVDDLWAGLTCKFGTPWRDHFDSTGCAACAAETERGCTAFAAAVAAGTYDADGYTPAERKRQAMKATAGVEGNQPPIARRDTKCSRPCRDAGL